MRFFLVFCLLYPLIFSQAWATSDILISPLKQIQTLRASGHFDEALQLGQNYLNAKPSTLDTDVVLVVGLMLLQKKDYTAAELYLNQVLKISPHYLDAKIALIQIRMAQKRQTEAQQLIVQVVQQAPNDPRVIKIQKDFKSNEAAEKQSGTQAQASPLKQIQTLRVTGHIDEALQLGQNYLNTKPSTLDTDVILVVGLMLLQKKDYTAAEVYLNQVLKISPHYLEAEIALIEVLIAQRRPKEAQQLIVQVVQQAPNDPRVIKIKNALAEKKSTPQLNPVIIVTSPLKDMQVLRAHGKLNQAIAVGNVYFSKHPQKIDSDVILLMGLMRTQKHDYKAAAQDFNDVLKLSPDYLDAKLGLITLYMAQKQYAQAEVLIKQVVKVAPKDARVIKLQNDIVNAQKKPPVKVLTYVDYYQSGDFKRSKQLAWHALAVHCDNVEAQIVLAQIAVAEKQYKQARAQFRKILMYHPLNKAARQQLINLELMQGNDINAEILLLQALDYYPNDPDFLAQYASLYFIQHKYARGANLDQQLLRQQPNNAFVKDQLKQVEILNPHLTEGLNEAGVNTEIDHVSALPQIWQYTSMYLNRDMSWGSASVNLNNASRFGINANQGALNLYPVINKNLYLRLTGAYANQPILFPTYLGGLEAYSAALPVELSLGATNSWIIQNIAFAQYTASVSKEWNDFLFSFRPNYYVPLHGPTSILYTGTVIRYFGPKDTFVRVTAGSGYSPNLANLTTVDFITVNNNFVTATIQFPVITHKLLMFIGGDYQHWVFSNNGQIWDISGGIVGLNYRD